MLSEKLQSLPASDKPVVCILSGGLDSTILLYLLKKKYDTVYALSFDYNQRHNFELLCAKRSCNKLGVPFTKLPVGFYGDMLKDVSALASGDVEMPDIKDVLGDPQPVTYVPFRNMLFMTFALSFAEAMGAGHIFIGLQAHDLYMYWDTTMEFVDRLNSVAELNRMHPISIIAPFVELSKKEEIEIGNQLGVPYIDTWTCYAGPNEHGQACGTCPSCAERIKNFYEAGVKDPVSYNVKTPWE